MVDPQTEEFKKEWGDYFELKTDTKKVHSRLGWIIGLSLLIIAFIFFRIDYTVLMPSGRFMEAETNQLGAYGGEFHYECVDGSCARVDGRGESVCKQDSECRHRVCTNTSFNCMEVDGPGEDECRVNSDCGHNACGEMGECIRIKGKGERECMIDDGGSKGASLECMHHECDDKGYCSVVYTPGNDTCSENSDCGHTICSDERYLCAQVPGKGADECKNDLNCGHFGCTNGLCERVKGVGEDTCSRMQDVGGLQVTNFGLDPKCKRNGCCAITLGDDVYLCTDDVSSFDCNNIFKPEPGYKFFPDTKCVNVKECEGKMKGCCLPECWSTTESLCEGEFREGIICRDIKDCKTGCCQSISLGCEDATGKDCETWLSGLDEQDALFTEGVDCINVKECEKGCCINLEGEESICTDAHKYQCNYLKTQDSGWTFKEEPWERSCQKYCMKEEPNLDDDIV